jgi:hypothetical protein
LRIEKDKGINVKDKYEDLFKGWRVKRGSKLGQEFGGSGRTG